MFRFRQKTLFPLATLALGVLWMYLGLTRYGFWAGRTGPATGFFPIIVSGVLILFSILAMLGSAKEEPATFEVEVLHLVCAVGAVLAATYVFGMLYSVLAFSVLWMKLYEKLTWKTTLVAALVLAAIIYGTFVYWLMVPFPEGMLFETTEI